MSTDLLPLDEHLWYGWETAGQRQPVFVTAIRPLRPAAGVIRLHFVQVRYPQVAQKVVVDFHVANHGPALISGGYLDDQGKVCFATLRAVDEDWIEHYEAARSRMPRKRDEPIDYPQDYMSLLLGESEYEILNWSHELAMPTTATCDNHDTADVPLGREYRALESTLIREGFSPRDGTIKWRLLFEQDELIVERSLTKRAIYRVQFSEFERCLFADFAHANRNIEVCPHPDSEKDRNLILSLIDVYLLRKSYAPTV
jgi:hypothetical protein